MKVKSIEWIDCGVGDDKGYLFMSVDNIPQILYVIRKIWDDADNSPCYRIEFSHGYVRLAYGEKVGIVKTVEDGKVKAQEHFEKYIMEHYLALDSYVPPNPDTRPELR
jgi:hypothetical protein